MLSKPGWSTYDAASGWLDPATLDKIVPFKSVDGTVVNQEADYTAGVDPNNPKPFWHNPYFSFNTSNEVPFARTYPDAGDALGHGDQLFEVQTGLEAPGLGCGQKLEPVAGGTKRPQCWLVVVPRGTPTEENPPNVTGVAAFSPRHSLRQAWANRIAIPLDFKPVDSTCALGNDERRIVGKRACGRRRSRAGSPRCVRPRTPRRTAIRTSATIRPAPT